ncbi:MAG: hypothetical protein K2V38_22095 [Gemmataceae bacterium]|nr:hypothetical protein [Gemmataceae bacterium]
MRQTVFFALAGWLAWGAFAPAQPAPKDDKKDAPAPGKLTAAADLTRTKALKAKVGIDAKDARLGDVLKEFAAQADMRADMLVLWTYGTGFPHAQKVTYSCKDKPLDVALDELLTKAGGGLGYVVVSKDGDKYDGWVRLTTTGERGTERVVSEEDEKAAADRLALAKRLIDGGKPDSAKPVLKIIAEKYPGTKAGMEAKQLLQQLEK